MVGYILIGLGAYLALEDYFKSRGETHGKLSEDGNGGRGSDSHSKPRPNGDKSDRKRFVKVPVEDNTRGKANDISEKPIQPVRSNQDRSGTGDNSRGQQDSASKHSKAKSVKSKPVLEKGVNKNEHKVNIKDDAGNDGNNVDAKSSGRNEPDSKETDKG